MLVIYFILVEIGCLKEKDVFSAVFRAEIALLRKIYYLVYLWQKLPCKGCVISLFFAKLF